MQWGMTASSTILCNWWILSMCRSATNDYFHYTTLFFILLIHFSVHPSFQGFFHSPRWHLQMSYFVRTTVQHLKTFSDRDYHTGVTDTTECLVVLLEKRIKTHKENHQERSSNCFIDKLLRHYLCDLICVILIVIPLFFVCGNFHRLLQCQRQLTANIHSYNGRYVLGKINFTPIPQNDLTVSRLRISAAQHDVC